MATYLPSSGAISIQAINALFGRGNNLIAYRGTTYYTSSAGPFTFSSGAINMNSFHGTGPTANRVSINYTFSANTQDASLNLSGLSGYIAGGSDITITVNSGVYLWASVTTNAGLTLTGGTTGDTLTIVNNGYIMGCGGVGVGYNTALVPAGNGGTALSIPINATINNTNASAYIGGGGGGGGGNGTAGGGGGAGGGAGGSYSSSAPGGTGGTIGSTGSNGSVTTAYGSGGGGGRIFSGTGGSAVTGGPAVTGFAGKGGGAGGGGGCSNVLNKSTASFTSGAGGSGNSAGGNASPATTGTAQNSGGGGGGWGAAGGSGGSPSGATAGASGGKAVALNGNTVTWVSGNTTRVYGAVA